MGTLLKMMYILKLLPALFYLSLRVILLSLRIIRL